MAEYPATDWGPWSNDEYDVGAPATAYHFERWFRNAVAAMQGATGAQRLHLGALERLNAGEEHRCYCNPAQSSVSGGTTFFGFSFVQLGTIRISAEVSLSSGNACQVRRWRGGAMTLLATWSPSNTYTYFSLDSGVWPGDAIQLYSAGTGCGIRNIKLKTGGADLFPGVYWPNTTQSPSPFVVGNRGIA